MNFFSSKNIKKIIILFIWMVVLSFIFVVPSIGPSAEITWRWKNMIGIFVISGLFSILYTYFIFKKEHPLQHKKDSSFIIHSFLYSKKFVRIVYAVCMFLILVPFIFGLYETKILTLVFIYIIFSLGINVVTGLGGMLCLGQALFLGMGAYSFAILNTKLGINFYIGLPIGIVAGTIAGLIVAFATIRLKGDYLAIVTLGLGEIFRLLLINFEFTGGPQGISAIEKPGIPWIELDFFDKSKLLYFIAFFILIGSIVLIKRLEHSRFGRSWESLREDEVASISLGINTSFVRLGMFAVSGAVSGIAGVLFASNVSFINPNSFSLLVSITTLAIVVLGGLGSVSGVVIGSVMLIMLPEYLRVFSQYRMLVFGAVLVIMMIFRPNGLIPKERTEFIFKESQD